MPNVSLGLHYERFVQDQLDKGRFQNASEVVRAGLRMLEDHEMGLAERRIALRAQLNAAFDDGGPSLPADEVFDRIERKHAAAMTTTDHEA